VGGADSWILSTESWVLWVLWVLVMSSPSLSSWPHTNLHKLQLPGRQFWELRQSARSARGPGRKVKRGRQMGKWYTLLYFFLHTHTSEYKHTQTQSRSNKLPHKCGVVRHVIDFILFLYPPDALPAVHNFTFTFYLLPYAPALAIEGFLKGNSQDILHCRQTRLAIFMGSAENKFIFTINLSISH